MYIIQHVLSKFGPADGTILILVSALLLAVVWQIITRVLHKRTLSRWQRELFYAIADGAELEMIARVQMRNNSTVSPEWKRGVQLWIMVTKTTLEKYSAQAGISFRYSPGPGLLPRSEYKALLVRLRSLREIAGHPDAYL
jgi:hypothetical protein